MVDRVVEDRAEERGARETEHQVGKDHVGLVKRDVQQTPHPLEYGSDEGRGCLAGQRGGAER